MSEIDEIALNMIRIGIRPRTMAESEAIIERDMPGESYEVRAQTSTALLFWSRNADRQAAVR